LFRKWKEGDSYKLRQLESEFASLKREFNTVKFSFDMLRTNYRQLEKKVNDKEVTHVQKVQVELHKPFDYDGWYP
jgi:predicted nuclease with TOPRIM domain